MNKRLASGLNLIAIVYLVLRSGKRHGAQPAEEDREPNNADVQGVLQARAAHQHEQSAALEQALATLANKNAWTGFAAKYGQPQVYLDPRSGAATSISTRVPLIPGPGLGELGRTRRGQLGAGPQGWTGRCHGRGGPDPQLRRGEQSWRSASIPTQLGAARAAQVSDTLWNVSIPQVVNGVPVRYGHLVAVINNGNLVLLGTETWGT